MTWTYSNDPGTSTAAERRDAVRRLTGDVDTTDQLLSDEEIAFFLSESSDDVYSASLQAVTVLIARFSRYVDQLVDGDLATYHSRRVQSLKILRSSIKSEMKRLGGDSSGGVLYGGTSVDARKSLLDDTDRRHDTFFDGRFD